MTNRSRMSAAMYQLVGAGMDAPGVLVYVRRRISRCSGIAIIPQRGEIKPEHPPHTITAGDLRRKLFLPRQLFLLPANIDQNSGRTLFRECREFIFVTSAPEGKVLEVFARLRQKDSSISYTYFRTAASPTAALRTAG